MEGSGQEVLPVPPINKRTFELFVATIQQSSWECNET